LRKAQEIHRVGARGLQAAVVLFTDGPGDGIRIGAEEAEFRVLFRVVVEASGKAADGFRLRQIAERIADRRTGSQVQKSIRSEDPTPSFPVNSCNNLIMNGSLQINKVNLMTNNALFLSPARIGNSSPGSRPIRQKEPPTPAEAA